MATETGWVSGFFILQWSPLPSFSVLPLQLGNARFVCVSRIPFSKVCRALCFSHRAKGYFDVTDLEKAIERLKGHSCISCSFAVAFSDAFPVYLALAIAANCTIE